jgi:hypothetical protein
MRYVVVGAVLVLLGGVHLRPSHHVASAALLSPAEQVVHVTARTPLQLLAADAVLRDRNDPAGALAILGRLGGRLGPIPGRARPALPPRLADGGRARTPAGGAGGARSASGRISRQLPGAEPPGPRGGGHAPDSLSPRA